MQNEVCAKHRCQETAHRKGIALSHRRLSWYTNEGASLLHASPCRSADASSMSTEALALLHSKSQGCRSEDLVAGLASAGGQGSTKGHARGRPHARHAAYPIHRCNISHLKPSFGSGSCLTLVSAAFACIGFPPTLKRCPVALQGFSSLRCCMRCGWKV